MFLNLFKVELRKHSKFLGFFIIIQLVLNILIVFDYNSFAIDGHQVEYFSWLLVFIYIFINVYRELYTGKNLLIHLVPMTTYKILLIKTLVFTLFLTLMWATSLVFEILSPEGIFQMSILKSSAKLEGTIYFILPRIISLFSGVVIIGFSVALGKLINNKVLSRIAVFTCFILITIGIYMVMKYNLINEKNVGWGIGNHAKYAYKQYSGIVALLVSSDTTQYIKDIALTIYWNNVFVNAIIGGIGLYISNLVFKSKRYEIS